MQKRIIIFDIGNTHIKVGLADHNCLLTSYALCTDTNESADSLGLKVLQVLDHAGFLPGAFSLAVASSVVPDMNPVLGLACERYLHLELKLAPADLPIPLENRYARPEEVGADRLLGAYAARRLFPQSKNIISVDFGTATTFDCVEDNAYLGGLICPGVFSAAAALASKTAKLPRISLVVEDDGPVVGRSTSTSLNHGFIFGFAAMTEGLCQRLAATMPAKPMIIGTGGFAPTLAKASNCFEHVYPDLLLEGLRLLCLESRLFKS